MIVGIWLAMRVDLLGRLFSLKKQTKKNGGQAAIKEQILPLDKQGARDVKTCY